MSPETVPAPYSELRDATALLYKLKQIKQALFEIRQDHYFMPEHRELVDAASICTSAAYRGIKESANPPSLKVMK